MRLFSLVECDLKVSWHVHDVVGYEYRSTKERNEWQRFWSFACVEDVRREDGVG